MQSKTDLNIEYVIGGKLIKYIGEKGVRITMRGLIPFQANFWLISIRFVSILYPILPIFLKSRIYFLLILNKYHWDIIIKK